MRKLLLLAAAGLLAAPLLASAQSYGNDPSKDPSIDEGQSVRTAMPAMPEMDPAKAEAQLFQAGKGWDIKGYVTQVESGEKTITLFRENLPPAELAMADMTKIKIDGKDGRMTDLQPGCEVRARFDLAEGKPVALEVKASTKDLDKNMKKIQKGMGMEMPEGMHHPMPTNEPAPH